MSTQAQVNLPAQTYHPVYTTSSLESESDTMWEGSSKITLGSWLDQTESAYENVNAAAKDDREMQQTLRKDAFIGTGQYTSDNKIISIAKRLNNIIDESPIQSNYSPHTEIFQALQEWEGFVLNIDEETFTARLIDTVNKENPEEEGDFLIEDLRKDDLKMLKPGAVFRWVIGYVIKHDGTKRRSSDIVFRRLPQWTQRDMSEADKEAKELLEAIDWR